MLGNKIYDCRKKNGLSQETLAEKLNVARQTISNWETGETSPNPDQLKLLSEVFNISIDELLDNKAFIRPHSDRNDAQDEIYENNLHSKFAGFEYKSKATVHGVPIVHINIGGVIPRRAKGIIAVGDIAQGIISIGGVCAGIVAIGGLSVGLISLGGLAVGLIAALGGCAIAPIACGAASLGLLAYGCASFGVFGAGGIQSISYF